MPRTKKTTPKQKPPRTLAEWCARHGVRDTDLDAVALAIVAINTPTAPVHLVACGAYRLGLLGKDAKRELTTLSGQLAGQLNQKLRRGSDLIARHLTTKLEVAP